MCEIEATDVLYLYFLKALPTDLCNILIRKLGKYSLDEIPCGKCTAAWETVHKIAGMNKQYCSKKIHDYTDRSVTHQVHEITLLLFSVKKGLSYNTGLISRQCT